MSNRPLSSRCKCQGGAAPPACLYRQVHKPSCEQRIEAFSLVPHYNPTDLPGPVGDWCEGAPLPESEQQEQQSGHVEAGSKSELDV